MEHNMPADTRDNDLHDPEFNDAEIGIAHNFIDCLRSSPDSLDQAEYAYPSAYHASTTGKGMTTPSPDEEPFPAPPPPLRQPQSPPVVAPIGDSQGYLPSPPFEEAGPTSSVWRVYLHESIINDSDTLRNKRGEAGLFSAVVSNFITTSSDNLQPDYQKMSAFLLFDQVNIQRGLANGISLDDIPTSGADPTIPFLPDPIPLAVNGLWWTSLTLSLVTAFFAILVDAWYCHYVSPIAGQPKVRARIRHLRYRGLIKWRLRAYISFLQLLLHSSLITFLGGLAINSLDSRSFPLAMVLLVIFILSILLYSISSLLAIIHPECPWKTPLSYILSATCKGPPITTIPRLASSLEVKNLSEFNKVQAWEIYAAHKSHIENEVDALHWLYEKSSTSAIHCLVIQALAGLSPDHKACAEEVFSPHWVEIRDEKERMLMDCMELARDGPTRWISKDIPNIGGRIEPLLWLEILFPDLRRKFPSRLFGEHNLDFSRKLSNTLSITLSAIDDAHIQKPTEQKQVVMDALADNGVHHPLVWKKLLDRYADKEKLFHDTGDIFTIKMCLNLVTSIYLRKDSPQELCSCTLADASVTYCKPDILKGLLSFFEAFNLQKDMVDPERRLSLAIVRALAPDSAPSTFNSHQRYPFHRDSTISKYQLLHVALHAIQTVLHHHPIDPPSKQWQTDAFWAIVSYMTSDIFIERSLSNSEYLEFMDLF
ncbi:uncharacterized protein ARMOST_22638 [Armillaria ostoyae]|uniref:DUF6535 domain-containing protein n=1 Tax=Armillaria ostoyae TaxID=47428 RepID=A0A284SDF2_ARMOS|nr:uncharacterized protein ARMOST_22638 [Armillaria ostoyae]